MKDYYAILGITPDSSTKTIKQAYRNLAKEIHPDLSHQKDSASFLAITEAYEILISPESRKNYDHVYTSYHRTSKAQQDAEHWNYRDILMEDRDNPKSLAKLICFDLLHDMDGQAIEIYEQASSMGVFSLKDNLDREDFMDFAFLLAEAYQKQDAPVKAYRILRGLARMEEADPYFKHFYSEVLDRLASIVRSPLHANDRLRITFLYDLFNLSWPPKEEAQLRKFLSELLTARGNYDEAAQQVFYAYNLAPGLTGLKETVKILEDMGYHIKAESAR